MEVGLIVNNLSIRIGYDGFPTLLRQLHNNPAFTAERLSLIAGRVLGENVNTCRDGALRKLWNAHRIKVITRKRNMHSDV